MNMPMSLRAGLLCLCLAGCSGSPELAPLEPDATILAFGDSLTFGTGVTAEQSYPRVLAGLTGRQVVRAGVPGEVSARGKARLPDVLSKTQPDLVVLCHGGNDVLRRMNPDVTEQNLREMIGLIRARGVDVVVLAVPKPGLFPEAFEYYERIADDLGVPVEMDILSDLMSDVSMKSDQVHFNATGYRRMAEAVQELLLDSGAL